MEVTETTLPLPQPPSLGVILVDFEGKMKYTHVNVGWGLV